MAKKKKEHVLFDRMDRIKSSINFNRLNKISRKNTTTLNTNKK